MSRFGLLVTATLLSACSASIYEPPSKTIGAFEASLGKLQERYHVPGMSALVAGPGGTIWESGFGDANVARNEPVTPETLFHLASLTKPFAAVIALQLEQEGLLDLNAPVSRYGLQVTGSDTVRVWHLLSHTSESDPPGTRYRYNGNRYGLVENAFSRVSGRTFAQLYDARIRSVLQLQSTVPNPRATTAVSSIGLDQATFSARLSQGYDDAGKTVSYESYFGPAAGMIANARDVAIFSRALDDGLLISAAARTRSWTGVRTPSGSTLPYGLGWFVQSYKGEQIVWHYGLWTGASALIVKVPARRLTFVLLGNSPGLSQPFPMGDGDVTASPFARLFLDSFLSGSLATH
jgi:CubicO group peptidase (beta-lactamase class C family)